MLKSFVVEIVRMKHCRIVTYSSSKTIVGILFWYLNSFSYKKSKDKEITTHSRCNITWCIFSSFRVLKWSSRVYLHTLYLLHMDTCVCMCHDDDSRLTTTLSFYPAIYTKKAIRKKYIHKHNIQWTNKSTFRAGVLRKLPVSIFSILDLK